jgi:hypothetical protein
MSGSCSSPHAAAAAAAGLCALVITDSNRSEWRFEAIAQSLNDDALFFIGPAGDSGLGAFAARDIVRGERILAEAPLVQWTLAEGDKTTAGLVALVNGLSPEDRATYCGLSQNDAYGSEPSMYGIWLTNALVERSPSDRTCARQAKGLPVAEHVSHPARDSRRPHPSKRRKTG